MSLSPVSAIAYMVAPVVLVTVSTIFANGLLTLSTYYADKVLALNEKRMDILRGPHGEMLDEDGVPPIDRERLVQIRDLEPLMIERHRGVRVAILIIWIAIGLQMLSVVAIAVAVTARSEGFALAALALVIAGVAVVFSVVALAIGLAKTAPIEQARIGMRGR